MGKERETDGGGDGKERERERGVWRVVERRETDEGGW